MEIGQQYLLRGLVMRTSTERGFTLIELMITVAIIAILAAFALPAYQDYVARSHVTEAISLATGAKSAITTHYGEHGEYPANNHNAGMASPLSINGKYVASVTIGGGDGIISVAFSSTASAKLSGQTLSLQVYDHSGSLRWDCGGVDARYLPSTCR
ncbi:pilin [Luteimonas terricola]|uniref:Pilin n=2 Tax=Luteimonas terricola TaxID=645597 RepID=A0ABQ2E7M1_9GAMM|nr:pilin [Luteimonas terricola]